MNVIIHEMFHIMGAAHEQARADRNDYIRVNWNNIPADWRDQFYRDQFSDTVSTLNCNNAVSNADFDACFTNDVFSTFDAPYDYLSVMHYPRRA